MCRSASNTYEKRDLGPTWCVPHPHTSLSPTSPLPCTTRPATLESTRKYERNRAVESGSVETHKRMSYCFRLSQPARWGVKPRLAKRSRGFASSASTWLPVLPINLTAPNSRSWKQPVGLFINNEYIESQGADRITTVNPAYGALLENRQQRTVANNQRPGPRKRSVLCMQLRDTTLIEP